MTEPSQPIEQTEFTPLSVEDMLRQPERKPGRQSAADKAIQEELLQQQRANYEALLAAYMERGKQIATLTSDNTILRGSCDYWEHLYNNTQQRLNELSNTLVRGRTNARFALKVLAELSYLMHDAEFDPSLTVSWQGEVIVTFANKYSTFEVVFDDTPKLMVTPADKKRAEITVELDSDGLTPNTVLMIKGHLGLADDGQLPKRAASALRKEEKPASRSAGLLGGLLSDCGNRNCPVHGDGQAFDSFPIAQILNDMLPKEGYYRR